MTKKTKLGPHADFNWFHVDVLLLLELWSPLLEIYFCSTQTTTKSKRNIY